MNPLDENPPKLDPTTLDMLVDGELTDAERRRLLARLDQIPEGWRACALAFLEAQAWREEFRANSRETFRSAASPIAAADRPANPPKAIPRRRSPLRRALDYGGTVLAMAASFMLALIAGTYFYGGPSREPIVNSTASYEPVPKSQSSERGRNFAGILPSSESPTQMVTLNVPGQEGGKRTLRLPAVEADHLDESWLHPGPDSLPPELREQLRQMGFQVQRFHRELIPVPMEDGRRLIVPVDQVEVHFVGNPSFR